MNTVDVLQQSPFADGVSRTALIMAAKRAIEQELQNPLFCDPYSLKLVGSEIEDFKAYWRVTPATTEEQKQALTRNIASRTRFLDDLILKNHQAKQVILLGAGLDTRAYRLPFPSDTVIYEIDRPEILAYKREVLSDSPVQARHVLIGADLAVPSWSSLLVEYGFDKDQPSQWIAEGLFMYLEPAAACQLLRTIESFACAGSILGCDLISTGSVRAGNNTPQGRIGKYWKFGTDEPEELLANYGWTAERRFPSDQQISLGRYSTTKETKNNNRGIFLIEARKLTGL